MMTGVEMIHVPYRGQAPAMTDLLGGQVQVMFTGVDVPSITNLVFLRRVNSRILYEQMIGRATRQCPEIGKEVFRIFDAVDLYPHLQNLTDMKPVVVNPSVTFEQLVNELIAAQQDAHRESIRDQLAVRLRRRLKKLPEEVRARYEAAAGEAPEATLKRLLEAKPAELSDGARRHRCCNYRAPQCTAQEACRRAWILRSKEGERVQRETAQYTNLARTTSASVKIFRIRCANGAKQAIPLLTG
jgi:type I site-specific restriction endonuclease